jgi:hypothetical protein
MARLWRRITGAKGEQQAALEAVTETDHDDGAKEEIERRVREARARLELLERIEREEREAEAERISRAYDDIARVMRGRRKPQRNDT